MLFVHPMAYCVAGCRLTLLGGTDECVRPYVGWGAARELGWREIFIFGRVFLLCSSYVHRRK